MISKLEISIIVAIALIVGAAVIAGIYTNQCSRDVQKECASERLTDRECMDRLCLRCDTKCGNETVVIPIYQ